MAENPEADGAVGAAGGRPSASVTAAAAAPAGPSARGRASSAARPGSVTR